MQAYLSREIKFLPGIGPKRAELIGKELSLHTFGDLLFFFPYKHIDRTRFYTVQELVPDEQHYIQLKGRCTGWKKVGAPPKERLSVTFADKTGSVEVVFFKGVKYMERTLKTDVDYILFGKPSVFGNRINFVHPELEPATSQNVMQAGLEPQYSTTERLKTHYIGSKVIRKMIRTVWQGLPHAIGEVLPQQMVERLHLLGLHQALLQIHFPQNADMLHQAEYRLKFEELFFMQLQILQNKQDRNQHTEGFVFASVGQLFHTFYRTCMPFELTGAQKRVIREIRNDMAGGRQMNRLLQGDVGSGKTLVALLCMLIAIDNGFQACIMAPTEILAQQHYQTLTRMLAPLPVRVDLLTGSVTAARRKPLFEQLADGTTHILIGTHALIEDNVRFRNLGLVVIDEQHRFGVAQRAEMWQKNDRPPHILVMTATPIPRTLAMTLYGDLDVSDIDELPPGRQPVKTYHFFDTARTKVFDFMKRQIAEGRQIYYVYPLIEESEKLDYENLEHGFMTLRDFFPEEKYTMAMVHGRMKPHEKDTVMQLFKNGEIQILVATTVIEVGVDVPNASVMVIESAERFGLSQMHQLRGRVGRGASQSFCILLTAYKLSETSRKRLKTMVETTDGFRIAEADLQLRGQGEIEGTRQSGKMADLQIADLSTDQHILQYAYETARDILDADPELQMPAHRMLRQQLALRRASTINWGRIS